MRLPKLPSRKDTSQQPVNSDEPQFSNSEEESSFSAGGGYTSDSYLPQIPPPPLTSELVKSIRFTISEPQGYYFDQVENFVQQTQQALEHYENAEFLWRQALHDMVVDSDQQAFDLQRLRNEIELFKVTGSPMVNPDGSYVTESQQENSSFSGFNDYEENTVDVYTDDNSLEDVLRQVQVQLEQTLNSVSLRDSEIAQLRDTVSAQDSDVAALRQWNAEMSDQVSSTQNVLNQKENEVSILENTISGYQNQIVFLEAQIESLKEQISQTLVLQSELDRIPDLETSSLRVAELEERLGKLSEVEVQLERAVQEVVDVQDAFNEYRDQQEGIVQQRIEEALRDNSENYYETDNHVGLENPVEENLPAEFDTSEVDTSDTDVEETIEDNQLSFSDDQPDSDDLTEYQVPVVVLPDFSNSFDSSDNENFEENDVSNSIEPEYSDSENNISEEDQNSDSSTENDLEETFYEDEDFDPYAEYDSDSENYGETVPVVPVETELDENIALPNTKEAAVTYPPAAPDIPLDTRGVPVEVWAPELNPEIRKALKEARLKSEENKD